MAGIFGELPTEGPRSLEEIQAPYSDWLAATAAKAWNSNPTVLTKRFWEYRNSLPDDSTEFDKPEWNKPGAEILDAPTATEKARAAGVAVAVPDGGITSKALDILIRRRQDEAAIKSTLARGSGGAVTGFGVGLAVSMLDPLNVASAFIPAVGPARYARMLAGAEGTLGRAGVRVGVGAAEGAIGAAAIEPLVYGFSQGLQDDYTLHDSLVNIAFGTALGGGLHAGAGYFGDRVAARWGRGTTPALMEQMPPEVREAALRTAVAQSLSGKSVDIQPLMQLPGTMERLSELTLGEFRSDAMKRRAIHESGVARINERLAKAEADRAAALERGKEIDPLKAEVALLQADIEAAQLARNNVSPAFDDASKARVQAIENDLANKPLSNKDRSRLEKERDVILQSVKDGMSDDEARRLVASYEQEIKGLTKALGNKKRALATAEKRYQTENANADRAARDAELKRRQLDDRLASQEDAILAETRRSIMTLASEGYIVRLSRQDATDMAKALLRAGDTEAQNVLENITETLKRISLRENGPLIQRRIVETANAKASEMSPLADEQASIAADRALAGANDNSDAAKVANDNLADALQQAKETAARLGDDELVTRELAQFDELQATAEGYAETIRAIASCQLRRGA